MAVSIISNGSLITSSWMTQYARHVDILGVSVDSFDDAVNAFIGRWSKNNWATPQLNHLQRVRDLCDKHSVLFKLNTVVCTANMHEDITQHVRVLRPYRWKVFQCMVLDGENPGAEDELRDAKHMTVNREQFDAFVWRHEGEFQNVLVPEPTDVM